MDSSLTKPWSKTFEELERDISQPDNAMPECGCGWPHHLLLPKGREDGMTYDLFVIVTNGTEDSEIDLGTMPEDAACAQPYHYCGLIGQNYPDKKPMAYGVSL